MHVVVAIKTAGIHAVQAAVLIDLGAHHILKRFCQVAMTEYFGIWGLPQASGDFGLMFCQPRRTIRSREGRRKIEVKARIDSPFAGNLRSPLGIRHEDHGAYGGNSTPLDARVGSVGDLAISPPIIGIYN